MATPAPAALSLSAPTFCCGEANIATTYPNINVKVPTAAAIHSQWKARLRPSRAPQAIVAATAKHASPRTISKSPCTPRAVILVPVDAFGRRSADATNTHALRLTSQTGPVARSHRGSRRGGELGTTNPNVGAHRRPSQIQRPSAEMIMSRALSNSSSGRSMPRVCSSAARTAPLPVQDPTRASLSKAPLSGWAGRSEVMRWPVIGSRRWRRRVCGWKRVDLVPRQRTLGPPVHARSIRDVYSLGDPELAAPARGHSGEARHGTTYVDSCSSSASPA
jgi:hypothetical protein